MKMKENEREISKMEYYDTYTDYAATIPLRFKVIPPKLNKQQFEDYKDLMDRGRWVSNNGENKVIMEVRGRHNLFRSRAPFNSPEVQKVINFLQPRISAIHHEIEIVEVAE
jgi:hypothetical protein